MFITGFLSWLAGRLAGWLADPVGVSSALAARALLEETPCDHVVPENRVLPERIPRILRILVMSKPQDW